MAGTLGRIAVAVSLYAMSAGMSTACGSCGDVNCGTGVVVWWNPADLGDAAGYRLCVNGDCEPEEPEPISGGRLHVAPGSAASEKRVEVRLELVDDHGVLTESFVGAGTRRGRCCPGLELRPTPDGRLVAAET